MDASDNIDPPPTSDLPPELRLRILSFLPPNDLALAGRLACKDAAQRFSQPPHRTAHLASLPLPGHVMESTWCVEGAETALKQLTLQQRVVYLMLSPRSGCEANVELAWRLVQPGLFPELLQFDRYPGGMYLPVEERAALDMGSAAIASGLAHLLPSLAQRCPGLLEPARTLEAAALHCDLAGLEAAWGLVGQLVHTEDVRAYRGGQSHEEWEEQAWRRVAAAAARTSTHDATAKLGWVLQTCRSLGRAEDLVRHAEVCAAAAASGELERLRWMRDHGFPWGTAEVLQGLMAQAEFDIIQLMEREGGYLPPSDHPSWTSQAVIRAALSTTKDKMDKLWWLVLRGMDIKRISSVGIAAGPEANERLAQLIENADTREVSQLLQKLDPWSKHMVLDFVFQRGSLTILRRLVEAGYTAVQPVAGCLLFSWPANTPADSGRLAEAVQLLAGAGWPLVEPEGPFSLTEGTLELCMAKDCRRHPWTVWRALVDAVPAAARALMRRAAAANAADTGCEATLEALAELPAWEEIAGDLAGEWYGDAAANGDLGTLACLRRLGVPLEGGALVTAVEYGSPLVALQWLVGQGVPVDREGLREEVADGLDGYSAWWRRWEVQAVREWLGGLLGEGAAGGVGGKGEEEEAAGGGQVQAHTAGDAGKAEEEGGAAAEGEGRATGEAGAEGQTQTDGNTGGEEAEEEAAAGGGEEHIQVAGDAGGERQMQSAGGAEGEEHGAAGERQLQVGSAGREGLTQSRGEERTAGDAA